MVIVANPKIAIAVISKFFIFIFNCLTIEQFCLKLAPNVLGLCEEAELEAQMFSLVQMFIRIPNVQFSTEPAFLQNGC
jgi:hypothetical protein